MIIEITAIRILSPYFGNTIFNVSSVISVVLAALSLGYYAGGKLADMHPEEKIFYIIIAASGFIIIFLHLVGIVFLNSFGYQLSIIEGPIVSALLLFFPQSFFLGILSPFAVKLQKMRVEELGVGGAAGQIFFWSTLGSIFGSLTTGFYLIPNFGLDKIILGVGFLLIILGLFGGLKIKYWHKFFLIALLVLLMPFLLSKFSLKFENVVYIKDSLYQKITIYDGQYRGRPARFLSQDLNSSAARFIDSEDLVYDYTKYYSLYKILNPDIKEALVIGGGAYSIPKAILQDVLQINVDVAEIDPLLFELAKKYFGVKEERRLKNFAEDGRRLLKDKNKKYDFVFNDAYSSFYSIPEHLTTQEFLEMAKEKLNDNGIFMANVIGSLDEKPKSFLFSEMRTFKSVFGNSYFFAVDSRDSKKAQNTIFVGIKGNAKIDFNDPKIRENKDPVIGNLEEKIIDDSKFDLSNYPILTDNFAPVDYLISKEFNYIYN